jgi:hypothetical protein
VESSKTSTQHTRQEGKVLLNQGGGSLAALPAMVHKETNVCSWQYVSILLTQNVTFHLDSTFSLYYQSSFQFLVSIENKAAQYK